MSAFLRLSGGRKLKSPPGMGTRPTTARVREAVMNLLAHKLEGSYWLDLCSGSGAICCEALERGAKGVVAVERDSRTAKICKSNLAETKSGLDAVPEISVFCDEALRWLNRNKKEGNRSQKYPKFDLVYLDPPYGSKLYLPILKALLTSEFLKSKALVVCEYSADNAMDTPSPWIEEDRRKYGSTVLVMVSRPVNCLDDTDSRRPQINQAK